ncbi:MAG: two-component regulator propeller domain-containing protein [Ferruginibacter sp.]
MKIRQIYLFILGQVLFLHSSSQLSDPSFIRISTTMGLSQGHVNDILKDRKGFMWFATDGGLNKYDGYTFKAYKNAVDNINSISNDFIYSVAEDNNGLLWIGTGSGLDKFDSKKEIFTHYLPGRNISINDVLIDHKGRIWLATPEGLFSFTQQNNSFRQYSYQPNTSNCLSNNNIYQLVEDNSGNIWIATKDGLNCFNPQTQQFVVYKGNPANTSGLQTSWIRSVYKDHEGTIWIGTIGSGIARYDSISRKFFHYKNDPFNTGSLAHNDVLSFAEDVHNNLWIGTENGGISVFNRQKGSFTTIVNDLSNQQSLSGNSVYTLYKDDIGNMWAGTWANGANLLPVIGKKFNTHTQVPGKPNSLSNPTVLSIAGDEQGDIWIGTDGGGLNRFNINTKLFTHYNHTPQKSSPVRNNFIISVIKAGDDLLALGYHRGGLDIFDTRKGQVRKHISIMNREERQFEISVNCLLKDRDANFWVGTWGGGVYLLDSKYNIIGNYIHLDTDKGSISSDFINCLMQDKDGNIWIGTDDGLNKLNVGSSKFIQYQHSIHETKSISHNEINHIYEDKKGYLWIATAGGLNQFDKAKEKMITFTEEDGLPASLIQSIEEDDHGILWLSTGNGIAAFNTVTKKSRNYNIDDGLQGLEFKNNCSFVNKDGYLFFGGVNGFNYFHPDSLRDNQFLPPVYVTSFQIFNKEQHPGSKDSILKNTISQTEQISLSYKQTVLTFGFASLNYTYSEKNQYAYMLEGFDKDWIYAGTNRSATYTNLDPATYVFRVKGSNNDGIWNEKGTYIRLIITPPFWKTWWFILLLLITIASLVVGIFRYRINNIKNQKIILEQQVKKQTEELVKLNSKESNARIEAERARGEADESNKKLMISNQEMEQFAYVASHDLKEPLRTTTSFVEILQKKYKGQLDAQADKYLHFISDASERMKVLINDLLEFSRIGSVKELTTIDCNKLFNTVAQDIDVAIKESNSSVKSTDLPIIKGYATEIKLLFQNLLVNAIKFRKKGVTPEIMVSALDKGSHWEFSVSDNGIGIDPKFKEKIFMIFQRLHGKAEYEGSGIGLSHCNKIAALHNGKIWVDSVPGEGSTFYVTIQKNII